MIPSRPRAILPSTSDDAESVNSELPPESPTSIASLESLEYERLKIAETVSKKTGTLTPLVKEEVRTQILIKRLKKGQPDLTAEIHQNKPQNEELTEEDVHKRQLRRERNKTAARKCRMKKRAAGDALHEEATKYQKKNEVLKFECERLKKEKEMLMDMLRHHGPKTCGYGIGTIQYDQIPRDPRPLSRNSTRTVSECTSDVSYLSSSVDDDIILIEDEEEIDSNKCTTLPLEPDFPVSTQQVDFSTIDLELLTTWQLGQS